MLEIDILKYMIKKVLLLFFIFCGVGLNAQKSIEIGLFGGTSYYLGDLNPGFHFRQPDVAYGAVARYNINPRWAMKLSIYRGKLKGDDATTKANEDRNLGFESKITDFSYVVELNFFDYVTGSTRNSLTPYIFAGVSVFLFKPTSGGADLNAMGTEGQNVGYDGRSPYKLFSFAIPFGIGFKYSLNKRLGVAFEWGMRKTFTDYIDDVSKTYYLDGESINRNDQAQVLSDPTFDHKPGMQRGDPKTKDWYNFTGISITYKINLSNNFKCTDFGNRKKY